MFNLKKKIADQLALLKKDKQLNQVLNILTGQVWRLFEEDEGSKRSKKLESKDTKKDSK